MSEREERIAQLIAHRACTGTEHDPTKGKLHGCCVVCGTPWPCKYAGQPPREKSGVCRYCGKPVTDYAHALKTGELVHPWCHRAAAPVSTERMVEALTKIANVEYPHPTIPMAVTSYTRAEMIQMAREALSTQAPQEDSNAP